MGNRLAPTSTGPTAPSDANASAGRYDSYLVVHKALRALQSETLLRLGRMDADDDHDTAAVIAQVRQLISLAETHLRIENEFVHPAMEARAPGSTRRTANDHISHIEAFERIIAGCDEVERTRGSARAAAALCLYRRFALFMAEDLVHMHAEETENNAVLWATHTDGEILQIVERIVASTPPEKKAALAHWMLVANTPRDRIKILDSLRTGAPPERFTKLVHSVLPHLPGAQGRKLIEAAA